eukprot:CAMPEP_0114998694 /NCGR_PEP_ID=MMETSP0216-20121206/15673_1 /TAXON_ID=223996 /ORGANISM="Protocruzia adherens, Strain Boccale" /LENGTH=245 /DNA_ID=CAMNT_0002363367 /DNA_START=35 /DNA_END=768 /DNA_ORIENTATION=+
MATLNTAKFDSDDEDEEYVPEEDPDYEEERPIERIVSAKSKSKADELWKLMQQDDYTKKKDKVNNSAKGDSIASILGNTGKSATTSSNSQASKSDGVDSKIVKNDAVDGKKKQEDDLAAEAMKAVLAMKKKTVEIKETLTFAGQKIEVSKTVDANSRENLQHQKKTLGGSMGALDRAVSSVTKKNNINSITKSQIDWKTYRKDQGLEDDLAKNRKDGYLAKKRFLAETESREHDIKVSQKRRRYT